MPTLFAPTHEQMTHAAANYLSKKLKCSIVLRDFSAGGAFSRPDAIGWRFGRISYLIECKVSRADYLRDAKKFHRQRNCPGGERSFLTPPGLLRPDELPEKWGLIEWDGKGFVVIVESGYHNDRDAVQELALLYSVLIRHPDDPQHQRVFRRLSRPTQMTPT